jgi:ApbE superfamily uncharacterized protein (UPF0280 family)
MRDPAIIRLLPDQRRLHLNDGPIDLILEATGTRNAVQCAYEAAARRFVTILDELCAELLLLRTRAGATTRQPGGSIARAMAAAVAPFREDCFITPMAAVAGAVAEAVLTTMTSAAELDRAYVNNGGDIALFLAEGQRYTIGMVERPDRPSLFGSFELSAAIPVRGVATSGWRGRSFSLGIADAVTVLAETAAKADAAATILANAVDLPGHLAIARVPACEIAPDSDLKELLVTRSVGLLSRHEIAQALAAGEAAGHQLQRQGLIYAAALSLQGSVRVVSPPGQRFALHDTSRSLIHA